jgi:putative ABC transport system permease protein
MLTDLARRLRALLRPSSLERELDDELEFHLQAAIERHQRSGLTRDEASRRARLELGGVEQVREACRDERGISPIDRLRQDVRFARRVLRKSPGFTVTVVGTLALGIGATSTAFGVVDGMLLKPLPYPEAHQLVQLGTRFGNISVSAMSAPDLLDVASRTKTLTAIAASRTRTFDVTQGGLPEQIAGAAVSSAFFAVLGVAPAVGRPFDVASDARGADPIVLLSHGFWQRRFGGDRSAIGRQLTLNGVPHTIVGVMPRDVRGPEALSLDDAAVWVPLGTVRGTAEDRDDAAWSAIGRLASGTELAQARSELEAIGAAIGQEVPGAGRRAFWIETLHARTIGNAGVAPLWLLFGAVSVVLIIACANIASLFLVRTAGRAHEMAIRMAMGATAGRLVRQLLAESVLVSGAGGALGVALAAAALGIFRSLAPADLPRLDDVGLDARVLSFSIAVTALAAVVFGLSPSVDARRTAPGRTLRGASTWSGNRAHTRFRGALVVVQMALALVLLVGATLLVTSLMRLGAVSPGFRPANVAWIDVAAPARSADTRARLAFFEQLLPAVRAVAGVQSAGLIGGRPLGGGNAVSTIHPVDRPVPADDELPRVPVHVVTPGYLAALGVPLIDGRDVGDDDRAASPRVAIVSRAFADRFWPGARAVGQRFWMGRVAADAPSIEVIGVAGDVLQYGLGRAPEPIVYRPLAQSTAVRGALSLIVRHDEGNAAEVLDRLREAIWRVDPALPLDRAGTMEAAVRASIGEPRFRTLALTTFAAIAAVVAGVGLYATLAWVVRARRRELGIRVVLGADAAAVRGLVLRRGLGLTVAGLVIGLAAAAGASRLLASMVFGVETTDPPTFAAAAGVLALVAAVACWSPARRAAAVDPIETLRGE